ncbi:MAG: HAMP domain-containing protein [Vicinamibacteria bacterium]|nr:HAMP domain-containing protein [Vicinamibacteria bacterium]
MNNDNASRLHPRRFRRRLLAVMLAVGLLPLLGWGIANRLMMGEVFSLSFGRLGGLLEKAGAEIERHGENGALVREIEHARLNLVQADLARRSLTRLMPRALGLALLVSLTAIALAAFAMGRSLARPIDRLTSGMARYARGELGHKLPESSTRDPDELEFLVRQFNRMGEDLAAQRARLEITEALAAWQGVARSLAHELKNPLTAMRMAVARIARAAARRDGETGERHGEALALVDREIDVLLHLAQNFSAFARLPAPQKRPAALAPLIDDVCALYRYSAPVPVERATPEDLWLDADPDQLRRALGNLVKNAVEASRPGDGPVRLEATVEKGLFVKIRVTDQGCGVGASIEGAAMAQSLGTTKAQGSGLGLPIAQKIIHEHGGTLRLDPLPGRGTVATVVLPLRSES